MESMSRGRPRNLDEYTELFVDILKICRPYHPYMNNPYENICRDSILVSRCDPDSTTIARCAPRTIHVANYSLDVEHFSEASFEHMLAVTAHESAHITHGTHAQENSRQSGHPREFWRLFGYNAQCVLDNLRHLENKWTNVDAEKFKQAVYNDANSETVDQRVWSPSGVRTQLRRYLTTYPRDTPPLENPL